MAAFQHEPIDFDGPAFRLLRLLQGSGLGIECELFQASFASDDLIPYEALSYTWGGTELSASVQINHHTLAVTENLYLALQYLRSRDADRILWVDAICIDQGNSKERGHQVGQMGTIYSRADRVIFWLGPPTDDTDILMDSLKKLEEKSTQLPCSRWSLRDKRWTELWSSLQPHLKNQHWGLAIRQKAGLETLLTRPWFQRVWVLQEVANAKRALVSSGTRSLSARIFALGPVLLNTSPDPHCQAVLDIMPGPSRKDSWWNRKSDLYTLLQKFRNSKAGDPRDMIYALLDISSDTQNTDLLRADYDKSVEQVVQSAILFVFGLPNYHCRTISEFLQDFHSMNHASLRRLASLYDANHIAKFLEKRKYDVKITMVAVEAAAGNQEHGAEVMRVLLKQSKNLDPISMPVVRAAAENRRSGVEVMKILLEHQKLKFPVTEEVVAAAVKNLESGAQVMTLLLQQHGEATFQAAASCGETVMKFALQQEVTKAKVTRIVVQAAARNGDSGLALMKLLLEQRKYQVEIDNSVVLEAAQNKRSGGEIMRFLLETHIHRFDIDQVFVLGLVRSFGPSVIEPLLTQRREQIRITEEIVHHASINRQAEQIMEMLVQQRAKGFEITSGLIVKLAQYYGPISMELLLAQRGDEVKITERLFKKVCKDSRGKIETIGVLLNHWGNGTQITEEVVIAAASNWRCGAQVVKLLLEQQQAEVKITEEVVKVAAGNPTEGTKLMRLLFERRGEEVQITEDVMKVAAGNKKCARPLLNLFLGQEGREVMLTEKVIQAALSNESGGIDTVELLLVKHAERFVVTEGLILELAMCFRPTLLGHLIQQRRKDIEVTDQVLKAAAGNVWCGEELMKLLLQQRDEVRITEDTMELAAGNKGVQNVWKSFFRSIKGHNDM
jgi:hypothetical protein